MNKINSRSQAPYRRNVLVVLGLVFIVFLFGLLTDISEKIWSITREYEGWQLDESILSMGVASFAGLVVIMRKMLAIETSLAELNARWQKAQQLAVGDHDHGEYVIKCLGCGKFQVLGDQWFSYEDFVTRSQNSDDLAGVCPSCRNAPNN